MREASFAVYLTCILPPALLSFVPTLVQSRVEVTVEVAEKNSNELSLSPNPGAASNSITNGSCRDTGPVGSTRAIWSGPTTKAWGDDSQSDWLLFTHMPRGPVTSVLTEPEKPALANVNGNTLPRVVQSRVGDNENCRLGDRYGPCTLNWKDAGEGAGCVGVTLKPDQGAST